jgi:hypothetical protein
VPGTRLLSEAWLAAAVGLFALDLAAHLPLTDFFDLLARRYGFTTYDAWTARVFMALGAMLLAALWWTPPSRRRAVRLGLVGLASAMVLAKTLLLVSAIENIHYPQYALLTLVLVRAGLGLETSWLAAGVFGVLDEAYQHVVLPRGTPAYLDANDIVFNAIGAGLGVVIAIAWRQRDAETPVVGSRPVAGLIALGLTGAALLGPLVSSPFFSLTPGGRRFHLLSPFEAVVLLGILWSCVRWLAARAQAASSGP